MKTFRGISKAFMIGILIIGWLAGVFADETLYAYRLEDFGYNIIQPPAQLPVVIVIANFAGQPAIAHNNYYYEDLLRNKIAMLFRAMSDGRLTIQHAGTINVNMSQADLRLLSQDPEWGEYRKNARVIAEAGKTDFDFARWDENRDGFLTERELCFLVIDNVTNTGAANRGTEPRCIDTKHGIQVCNGKLALAGHRTNLTSMAHEISHSLGGLVDLYGDYDFSYKLTLMGATGYRDDPRNYDIIDYWHFDPWHKMALGWHRPTMLSLREPHMNIPLHAKASDSPYNSYILYDPSHGNQEFFMVEFRTPTSTSASGVTRTIYDTNVAGTGVVIWHVNLGTVPGTGSFLKPRNLSEPPQHIPGMFALGAGLNKLDTHRLWGPGTETPPLRWLDGSSAGGAKIWVHNFAANATDITISIGQQLTAPVAQRAIALERDTDRPGADYWSRETSTVDQCAELCRGDSRCNAFTHYHGRCYLKSAVPPARPLQGAVSGINPDGPPPTAVYAPQPTVPLERDTDRPGSDFFSTRAETAEQCISLCRGDARCRAFTHYQGNCWLKSAVPATRPLQGAVSGVIPAAEVPAAREAVQQLDRNTDRPGSDFYSTRAETVEQCISLCQGDARCRAFTHYQGTCWLKSAVPAPRPLQGATSGIR